MRSIAPAVALAILASLSATALAQTTYRWVDDQGQVHFSDRPPPANVKALAEKRFSADRPDPVPSYTMSRIAADFPVTLYTAADCAEPCENARALLDKRGVPYREVAVLNEEDLARFRELFGPPDEVPAATVGRQRLRGFEQGAWNTLLDQVGYPHEAPPTR